MQLRLPTAWLGVTLLLGVSVAPASAIEMPGEPTLGGLLRLFTDSEKVSVRSASGDYEVPLRSSMALRVHWMHERVTIPGISAPAGSAEALDAITTASRPIAGDAYTSYSKQRNEWTSELSRGPVGVAYYHSIEDDYTGRQLSGRWEQDLRGDQLNLSIGSSYGWDTIEPAADDDTQTGARSKRTLHGNLVATQIVSSTTVIRAGIEVSQVEGLQHNPYRNVFAGGSRVPERHPEARQRRDVFVRGATYLPNRSSIKLHYRLYNDDWGVLSHEVDSRLSQYLTQGLYAQYQYRWYTQRQADFWRAEYVSVDGVGGMRTGDYRLGPLASHLFGAALGFDLRQLAPDSRWLRPLAISVHYERYFNSNNYSADILETGIDVRF